MVDTDYEYRKVFDWTRQRPLMDAAEAIEAGWDGAIYLRDRICDELGVPRILIRGWYESTAYVWRDRTGDWSIRLREDSSIEAVLHELAHHVQHRKHRNLGHDRRFVATLDDLLVRWAAWHPTLTTTR